MDVVTAPADHHGDGGGSGLIRFLGYVPFTVLGFAVLTYYFAVSGAGYERAGRIGLEVVFNPLLYVGGLFFHVDMGHYWGNMTLLVPVGVLLTWLTSNRHVAGVMLVSHLLARIVHVGIALSIGIITVGVGSSLAVFGVLAAALVRSIGVAFADLDSRVMQGVVYLALGIALLALFLLAVAAGSTVVDHLGHALGFLFGGAVEAIYVFERYGKDEEEVSRGPDFMHRRR